LPAVAGVWIGARLRRLELNGTSLHWRRNGPYMPIAVIAACGLRQPVVERIGLVTGKHGIANWQQFNGRCSVIGNQHDSHARLARRQHHHGSQWIAFPWISATASNDPTGGQWSNAVHVSSGMWTCWYQNGATEPDLAGRGRSRHVLPRRGVGTIESEQGKSGQQRGLRQAGHDRSQRSTARKRFGDPSQYRVPHSSRM